MELNEMEKRLIFQTEGYGKSDVTYELRMCLPYIPDPVKRKTAAELMRKLDAMPEKDCLALIQDIRKNYRIPAGPKTMTLAALKMPGGSRQCSMKISGSDISGWESTHPAQGRTTTKCCSMLQKGVSPCRPVCAACWQSFHSSAFTSMNFFNSCKELVRR